MRQMATPAFGILLTCAIHLAQGFRAQSAGTSSGSCCDPPHSEQPKR
jgi:hypothetical protein